MTKEDRLNDINDYIHYLDDTYAEIMKTLDINKVKVTALGFSQQKKVIYFSGDKCSWQVAGRKEERNQIPLYLNFLFNLTIIVFCVIIN